MHVQHCRNSNKFVRTCRGAGGMSKTKASKVRAKLRAVNIEMVGEQACTEGVE